RDPALADRPLHMSMGAYGPKTGMPRILDLLDRYGIKTCIFIPGWIVERYPALCEDIVRRGHEVGHHGYLHEKPFFMKSRDEEEALLVKSLDIFKKVLGVKPLGSRTPSADPSAHTMEMLRRYDFVYHSNALDTDLPYCHQTKHGPLVEFPTAWCNNDAPFFMWSSVPRWATASGASRTCGRSGPRSSRASTRRAASSTGSPIPRSSAGPLECAWSSGSSSSSSARAACGGPSRSTSPASGCSAPRRPGAPDPPPHLPFPEIAVRYRWPDGKQSAAVLSFDFDAESGFYFREPEK